MEFVAACSDFVIHSVSSVPPWCLFFHDAARIVPPEGGPSKHPPALSILPQPRYIGYLSLLFENLASISERAVWPGRLDPKLNRVFRALVKPFAAGDVAC